MEQQMIRKQSSEAPPWMASQGCTVCCAPRQWVNDNTGQGGVSSWLPPQDIKSVLKSNSRFLK